MNEEAGSQMEPAYLRVSSVRQCQFADLGTERPPDTWCGVPLFDGATSKSKIAVGM